MPKRKRKSDSVDKLFRAAAQWLKDKGGIALVAGGPHIITMPGDNEFAFYVAVKVMGKRPPKKEQP